MHDNRPLRHNTTRHYITRDSRPAADGTLTEKTSKRRGDGRAAYETSSRGGGGGGANGERAKGAEKESRRAPPPKGLLQQKGMSASTSKEGRDVYSNNVRRESGWR